MTINMNINNQMTMKHHEWFHKHTKQRNEPRDGCSLWDLWACAPTKILETIFLVI